MRALYVYKENARNIESSQAHIFSCTLKIPLHFTCKKSNIEINKCTTQKSLITEYEKIQQRRDLKKIDECACCNEIPLIGFANR